jgi:DNA-binding CsgD family transcriptional regulator
VPTSPVLLLEEPDAAVRLTRLVLATGERGLAESIVACADRLVSGNPGFPSIRAAAAHARALLDENAALLEQAEDLYAHPMAAASAAEDAGVLLARRDPSPQGQDAAREAFERAIAAYKRVGAVGDTDRMRARLRALGIRPRHWSRAERPPTGWSSLTDTELRVARIVSEGATNAEAANRLFLSRHTVGFHLRHIFLKLGIRSRVELTRLTLQNAAEAEAS